MQCELIDPVDVHGIPPTHVHGDSTRARLLVSSRAESTAGPQRHPFGLWH